MKIGKLGVWTTLDESDANRAREAARKALAFYLQLPNYLNHWRRMGFNNSDFENGGSNRLIDDTVAWGDRGAIIERIEQHWEAGADHVCLQTIDPNNPTTPMGIPNVDEAQLSDLARELIYNQNGFLKYPSGQGPAVCRRSGEQNSGTHVRRYPERHQRLDCRTLLAVSSSFEPICVRDRRTFSTGSIQVIIHWAYSKARSCNLAAIWLRTGEFVQELKQ